MGGRIRWKNPLLRIPAGTNIASLMMLCSDPCDRFFCPHLTLMKAKMKESELKLRGSTDDNSKIIFLTSQRPLICHPSLEPP